MDDHSSTSSASESWERINVKPRQGRTLIVGSKIYRDKEDRRKRYADVVGIDMEPGEGVDLVLDLEESIPPDLIFSFDHVECMSVLEHSRRPWLLAANIERMLRPGGTLFAAVPFIWRHHDYPDDYFRFTVSGLASLFPDVNFVARSYVHRQIEPDKKIKAQKLGGFPYFPRTETLAFGVRK
jgi:SAM-dependent methyltransferase